MEFFTFTKAYVDRLRAADPATEQHFVTYFGQLLRIKLRARCLASEIVDELRQETFIRVIVALRKEDGIRQPERLGAFVNSTCNNVLQEFYRSSSRSQPLRESDIAEGGNILDVEDLLVTRQAREHIGEVLDSLPERDRRLLRAIFLEEKHKDEVCREFGVDRDYLRVLLYRAKDRFKAVYQTLYERDKPLVFEKTSDRGSV